METKTEIFNKTNLKEVPAINPGDTVKVHQKIKEGAKERIQIFEGIVIAAKHGTGISGMITVRKVVEGVGVERIFPLHSPSIAKFEVIRSAKVRRSKLYYLRTTKGKRARLKSKDLAIAVAKPLPADEVGEAKEVAETPAVEAPKEEAKAE